MLAVIYRIRSSDFKGCQNKETPLKTTLCSCNIFRVSQVGDSHISPRFDHGKQFKSVIKANAIFDNCTILQWQFDSVYCLYDTYLQHGGDLVICELSILTR